MEAWYRDAVENRAPSYLWGSYYSGYAWKIVGHTTEGYAFYPASSTYYGHRSYPHFTVTRNGVVYQHIPITRAARALRNRSGGVQTNGGRAIQIEFCAKSGDAPNTLTKVQEEAGRKLIAWIRAQTGVQAIVKPAGVVGGSASQYAPQRMSNTEWINFNGLCGHRHVPENDHWNMGAYDMRRLLTASTTFDEPSQEDDMIKHGSGPNQYNRDYQFAINRFFTDMGGGPPHTNWLVKDGVAGDKTFEATWEAILRLQDPAWVGAAAFQFMDNGRTSLEGLIKDGISPVLVAAIVSAASHVREDNL